MNRKVVFWLEPNQSLVPVDQIPDAIAEALYPLPLPQPFRYEESSAPLKDSKAPKRLLEKVLQAGLLKRKYPTLHMGATLSIEEASSYLAEQGFELDIRRPNTEFYDTFDETTANGKSINWRYWMSMKTLTAAQSSRLMVGLDPDIFTNLNHNGPARINTSKRRGRARDIERLALNLGMTEAPASEWLAWAKSHGFSLHKLFVVEVEGKGADDEPITAPAVEPESAHSAAPNEAKPASNESSEQSVTTHKIETRTNALTAVISTAIKKSLCPNDAHSIWAAFVAMADNQNRPYPLLGYVETEGVKYQNESGVAFITKENLLRRVRRKLTNKNR